MKEKYHRPQIEEVKLDFDKLAEVHEKSPYFRWIKDFKKEFPKAGVFLVGGSVRDIILNRSSKDYDFIVRGVSAAHLKNFLATHGRVDLTGSTFGVFKFRGQGFDHEIDIALPRREQAGASGGYRDVETQSDPEMPIEGDLGRRDFTVNAMAWDSESGQVIDPWKGVLDLKSRVIRAVGDPSARFGEDYSRMLRALRQAAQFNFSIEEKTLSAIKELIGKINASAPGGKEEQRLVPYEVISREFLKGFVSDPVRTIDLWAETGALKEVFPEILELKKCAQSPDYHSEGDVFTHSRLALEKTRSPEFKKYFPEAVSARALVAILFHDIGKPETAKKEKDSARPGGFHISFHGHEKVGAVKAEKILRRMKVSAAEGFNIKVEDIVWLAQNHLLPNSNSTAEMRPNTIKKYFLDNGELGRELMQVALVDAMASLRPDGGMDLDNWKALWKKLEVFKKIGPEKNKRAILSGDEVMKALKIKPGKQVGEILAALTDEQLSGRIQDKPAAIAWLRVRGQF